MYKRKIVCALKHNNTPLTEDKDTVYVPLNSEYSIYLKNMSDLTAYIKIYINGRDISPSKKVYLTSNCSATITQFEDTNHSFSFKERTHELQKVRTNLDEDGLILIDVEFEEKEIINKIVASKSYSGIKDTNMAINNQSSFQNKAGYSEKITSEFKLNNDSYLSCSSDSSLVLNSVSENQKDRISASALSAFANCSVSNEPVLKSRGITVPGKKKVKKDNLIYTYDSPKYVEEKFQIILNLEGTIEETISKEIKKDCPTCNTKFKSKYFYCPFDGTFLD